MIYLALAVVITAGLAWDYGRRRLLATTANDVHREQLSELCGDIGRVDDITHEQLDNLRGRLLALEYRATEPADARRFDSAIVNLGKQLQELSLHVDTEIKKVRTAQAGNVAAGRRPLG
jgi:hypothetical protein